MDDKFNVWFLLSYRNIWFKILQAMDMLQCYSPGYALWKLKADISQVKCNLSSHIVCAHNVRQH